MIILTRLIITVKILIAIVKIKLIAIMVIIIMAIKIMIIVTKIKKTVIMKTTIVIKLTKIVVQSYNLKTYIYWQCPARSIKKASYCSTLPQQVQSGKGTKSRDLQTLSSILRPKGAIVFRIFLQ